MALNKVQLIGNLGADPEVRRLTSGDPVVSFRLATSETWRDKTTGEKKERTEWHSVVIFNSKLCEVVEKYVKKGHKVYVEGQLSTRKWTGQDGVERYTTEIVLRPYRGELDILGSPGGARPPAPDDDAYGADSAAPSGAQGAQGGGYQRSAMDDDIPFSAEWR